MYYLIILVLLFLAELFISVLRISVTLSISLTNVVHIPGLHCVVEGSSFILAHWLISWRTILNILGLYWP